MPENIYVSRAKVTEMRTEAISSQNVNPQPFPLLSALKFSKFLKYDRHLCARGFWRHGLGILGQKLRLSGMPTPLPGLEWSRSVSNNVQFLRRLVFLTLGRWICRYWSDSSLHSTTHATALWWVLLDSCSVHIKCFQRLKKEVIWVTLRAFWGSQYRMAKCWNDLKGYPWKDKVTYC